MVVPAPQGATVLPAQAGGTIPARVGISATAVIIEKNSRRKVFMGWNFSSRAFINAARNLSNQPGFRLGIGWNSSRCDE